MTGFSFYLTKTNWNNETNNVLKNIGRPYNYLFGIGHPVLNEIKELKKLSKQYHKLEVDDYIKKNILNSPNILIRLRLSLKKMKYKLKEMIK